MWRLLKAEIKYNILFILLLLSQIILYYLPDIDYDIFKHFSVYDDSILIIILLLSTLLIGVMYEKQRRNNRIRLYTVLPVPKVNVAFSRLFSLTLPILLLSVYYFFLFGKKIGNKMPHLGFSGLEMANFFIIVCFSILLLEIFQDVFKGYFTLSPLIRISIEVAIVVIFIYLYLKYEMWIYKEVKKEMVVLFWTNLCICIIFSLCSLITFMKRKSYVGR